MTRIKADDTLMNILLKLCEGNPGAVSVCSALIVMGKDIDKDSALSGFGRLLILDANEIYGADIWMLYKDVCGEDIEKTIAVLRACQLGITPLSDLKHAIAHQGAGLKLDEIIEQVKERLPNFGLERGEL